MWQEIKIKHMDTFALDIQQVKRVGQTFTVCTFFSLILAVNNVIYSSFGIIIDSLLKRFLNKALTTDLFQRKLSIISIERQAWKVS